MIHELSSSCYWDWCDIVPGDTVHVGAPIRVTWPPDGVRAWVSGSFSQSLVGYTIPDNELLLVIAHMRHEVEFGACCYRRVQAIVLHRGQTWWLGASVREDSGNERE